MVTVSVVMPVWREPLPLVRQALESILAQTHTDFEFLIFDDGGGREELRNYLEGEARRDLRIRLYVEPHRGLTPTLNRALVEARGEIIARQDADDWSEPERLSRQVAFLGAHPELALVGSDAWAHQENGGRLWLMRLPHAPEDVARAFDRGNPLVHGATCYRRRIALDVGGYRESFPCSQDYDFFWRLADRAGGANLDEALYHYRFVAQSVSARRAGDQALAHRAARLLAQMRRRGETEDVEAALARAAVESGGDFGPDLKQADHLMLAGHYTRALASYGKLAAAHPLCFRAWGKLARWGVFVAAPPARRLCFR